MAMPQVDVSDETFVAAPADAVARWLRNPEFWNRCWPGLTLVTYHDRGVEGLRWYVHGRLTGTAEVWLEPYRDGTLVHVFLRADPLEEASVSRWRTVGRAVRYLTRGRPRQPTPRRIRRQTDAYARPLKGLMFGVKDRLEETHPAGGAAAERASRPGV